MEIMNSELIGVRCNSQGKQSFITLRDLFRWAERYRFAPKQSAKFYDWDQHLADEGYLVLAGRVRVAEEAKAIMKVKSLEFLYSFLGVNIIKIFSHR